MSPGPCKGCRERFVGCHGRTAEGAWRCPVWGRWQEELDRQQTASAAERLSGQVQRDYIYESKARFRKMKEQGKPMRR